MQELALYEMLLIEEKEEVIAVIHMRALKAYNKSDPQDFSHISESHQAIAYLYKGSKRIFCQLSGSSKRRNI